ncbi:MAG: helicase-related protein [bacterium]|nr:helicase-related protein [bacterium]
MGDYSDIIDNRKKYLKDEINDRLSGAKEVKFAVGYLYPSGLYQIAERLGELENAKILAGTLSKDAIEFLAENIASEEELKEDVEIQRKSEKEKIKTTIGNAVGSNIAALPHSLDKEDKLRRLCKLIKSRKIKIKLYTKHPLHAKAYIFKHKDDVARASAAEGIGIIGSSNLTISGFHHNTELNTYVRGQKNFEEMNDWFDKLWEEAIDFEQELTSKIEESWALKTVNPYDIYILTLYHLVKGNLEKHTSTIWNWDDMPPLYSFQKVAIMQAYQWLNEYNGVFISDVVGLGKTFIGAGLLRQLNKRALVISPPGLVEMWEKFGEKFKIDLQIISRGMLYKGSYNKESILKKYEGRDVVLIDESHHFRNSKAKMYQELQPFLINKQVILMTATPQNTSLWNIYNQIKLFAQSEENIFPVGEAHLRNLFKKAEEGKFPIKELLKHILIRRTRNHIKQFYKGQDEFEIEFPERDLKTITYNINDTYHNLYKQIRGLLSSLTYARYNLWKYVLDDKKNQKPYTDLKGVVGTLKVFHKINLFKRLESSIFAFRMTIKNLLGIYMKFKTVVEKKGIVPAGEKIQERMYRCDLNGLLDGIEELAKDYKAEDFDIAKLKKDLKHDIDIFEKVSKDLNTIPEDDDKKLERLREIIEEIKYQDKKEKILIFSEYADTVNYLKDKLTKSFELVDYATGDTKNILRKIQAFSPEANDYDGQERIDIMVATDVLGEGHNLQDCSAVINYDLHWNPVRLIQRAGRVDRIGSKADVILVRNFLPVDEVEKEINLKDHLQRRIEEIHSYIGEDSQILEEDEQLNQEAMYTIYDKKDIDELEKQGDVEFSFEEAENIIRQIEKDNPEYLSLIKKMQLGLRSAKEGVGSKGTYAFFRSGCRANLLIKQPDGTIIDDFSKVINEIRCERHCPEKAVTGKDKERYFNDLNELKAFTKASLEKGEIKERVHPEVRRTKRRLQELISDAETQDFIENAEKIDAALNEYFPYHLVPVLKRLNKQKYSEEEYFNELVNIYNKEKLGEIVNRFKSPSKVESIEFICGEILV